MLNERSGAWIRASKTSEETSGRDSSIGVCVHRYVTAQQVVWLDCEWVLQDTLQNNPFSNFFFSPGHCKNVASFEVKRTIYQINTKERLSTKKINKNPSRCTDCFRKCSPLLSNSLNFCVAKQQPSGSPPVFGKFVDLELIQSAGFCPSPSERSVNRSGLLTLHLLSDRIAEFLR